MKNILVVGINLPVLRRVDGVFRNVFGSVERSREIVNDERSISQNECTYRSRTSMVPSIMNQEDGSGALIWNAAVN